MSKSQKESVFSNRWGKDSAFNKNVDRAAYELCNPKKEAAQPVNDQILNLHKLGPESNTRLKWMNRLAKDALAFIADQRGAKVRAIEEESQRYLSTKALIERLYYLLQVYALYFNQTAGWSSLQVTCTKPAFVTEVLRYNKLREPVETITTFRCRLSTRFLSLVLVGRIDCIEFRLLPVEEVIGLSRTEAAYEPFLVIDSYVKQNDISWTICDEPLSNDSLEDLCMDLFSILIEQTKDEAAKNQAV